MRYKKILISAITCFTCLITAAMPVLAAEESITQDATAWFFGCDVKSGNNSAAVTYYQPGDCIRISDGSNNGVGPVVYTKIESECTYTITVDLHAQYDGIGDLSAAFNNELSFMSVTDSLPVTYGDFITGIRHNSAGTLYTDLVTLSIKGQPGNDYGNEFTFIFSTADGYIDNLETGEYYLSFLLDVVEDITNSIGMVQVIMDSIEVTCTFDPNAEYYRNLLLSNLDEQGKELAEIGLKSSEHENWALDQAKSMREQASEQMQNNIDITKNFFGASTFARSGTMQAAASAFMGVYNSIMVAIPYEVQAIFVIIPTLAFIGWVIGRVQ